MSGDRDDRPKLRKAYEDERFLKSAAARPLRILAEYQEPWSRFQHYEVEDTIVFFGSARMASREEAEAEVAAAKGQGAAAEAKAARRLENAQYYEATRELAYRLTEWSKNLDNHGRRFVVCSGGGPGIMEAANRGASEAKGLNVGLNITLPFEQVDNPFITRELNFQFHYFFMRKFWFIYLAKALVIMPGGFGTLDELFETLTLRQTGKIKKAMPIVLFGQSYWSQVLNFDALVAHGTIDAADLELFFPTDSVDEAFDFLTEQLTAYALDQPGLQL